MSTPRPFVLVGASRLARVQEQLQSSLGSWRERWGIEAGHAAATCLRASELDLSSGTPWRAQIRGGAAVAWSRCDERFEAGVAQAVFGPGSPAEGASIALEVGRHACNDLIAKLLGAAPEANPMGDEAAQPPQSLLAIGSGAIHASIDVEGARLEWLVPSAADVASAAAPTSAAVEAPDAALLDARVTVFAEIGSAEVSVEELRSLSVGDVICLGHRLDEPVRVTGPDGQALFLGHLGMRDGSYALDVIPESPRRIP